MQWLRHTRASPPSINEQQLDEVRQVQLKQLAAEADARWASKPSFLSAPSKQPDTITSMLQDPGGGADRMENRSQVVRNTSSGEGRAANSPTKGKSPSKESPWKKFGKDAEQQPEPWAPKLVKRQ
jgi:NADH dehydrogenase [ubiquinone] 1 alpha subcomplex assembly factor 2